MPIYMDRHEIPATITAEDIAKMHHADLKIEHKFNCRGLTYWCDEERKTAFCLVEAPNAQAVHDMHDHAHGDVPHTIIEVESNIVESFLGRISDPVKAKKTKLNIINEPAFRILMVTELKRMSLENSGSKQFNDTIYGCSKSIIEIIKAFNGSIVKQRNNYFLTSFNSVTDAVSCSLEIKKVLQIEQNSEIELNIGLSAGIPVTDKKGIFEDTIKVAEYLSDFVKGSISITSEIKELYESENRNVSLNEEINTLSPSDEDFLKSLMTFIEENWKQSELKTSDVFKHLGYSKSKLYREMVAMSGKSINTFIREYRLNKALDLIDKQTGNISEIAFDTGFSSPAYFSKSFLETYGVLPSVYTKQAWYS
ncbi:MAG: nickel-binding protein [Cellulophaga sp.]